MSSETFARLARSSSRVQSAVASYCSGKIDVQGDLRLAKDFGELADSILVV